jgi:hypothetical protein
MRDVGYTAYVLFGSRLAVGPWLLVPGTQVQILPPEPHDDSGQERESRQAACARCGVSSSVRRRSPSPLPAPHTGAVDLSLGAGFVYSHSDRAATKTRLFCYSRCEWISPLPRRARHTHRTADSTQRYRSNAWR